MPTSRALRSPSVVATLQPEKRLLAAVLEDAIGALQHYVTVPSGRGRLIFVEAAEWFASPAADWPFDFEYICQALDLDASYVRETLERWCNARRADTQEGAAQNRRSSAAGTLEQGGQRFRHVRGAEDGDVALREAAQLPRG